MLIIKFFCIFITLITAIHAFSFDDALKIHLNGHQENTFDNSQPTIINQLYRRNKREINFDASEKTIYVQILINNENITFELENHSKNLLLSEIIIENEEECIFQGKSIKPNNSFIVALTGCGNGMQGIILTNTDEYYLLKPPTIRNLFSNISNSHYFQQPSLTHTIQKRSANIASHHSNCGFDLSPDPYPEDRFHVAEPSFLAVHKFEELVIELGVFVDDAMWAFFEKLYGNLNAEKEVRRFVIAAVNNIDILFTRTTLDPKVRLKITHFEILKSMPMPLTRTYHNSGDVTKMLNSFCKYQSSINPKNDADPKHWDHALLLTGYDLYRDGVKTIAGYAPVKGMCEQMQNKSCTVNEGLDFGAVFVIAHEMGHSLGMYHDGESNQCHPRCCIMSPSIGAGKTQWSGCSVNELHVFVSKLGSGDRPSNCLIDDRRLSLQDEKIYLPKKDFPGQQYSLDEQCSLFHGQCWKHELQIGQTLKDVCDMVWCTNGESIVRNTHPALEGSYCGPGKICIEGNCISAASKNIAIVPINGKFGEWDDSTKCTQGCNECKIDGQMRVKRSIRKCNNPYKLNGGLDCTGSYIRGVLCGREACRGMTVNNYAIQKCTTLKSDPNLFYIGLNGKGLQFIQAPCKVWCMVGANNDIKTMADFPDGTPCGKDKYCLRGDCLALTCSKPTIVANPGDCPIIRVPRKDPIAKREINNSNPFPITGTWLPWKPWSECVSSGCGEIGIKERERECIFKENNNENGKQQQKQEKPFCIGAKRQRSECILECQT